MKILVTFVLLFCAGAAGAQEPVAESSATVKPVAYPLIMYTPENSLMFGGGAVLVIRRGERQSARPDNITVNALYTLKNQTVLQAIPEFYAYGERLKLRATLLYQNMPTTFYGIGNSGAMSYSDLTAREQKYTSRLVLFQPQISYAVWGQLRAGVSFDLKNTKLLDKADGGSLAAGSVNGSNGGITSGLGALLEYDGRDSLFFPTGGVFAQGVARMYRKALGSDYSYNYYSADLRAFKQITENNVLAFQLLAVAAGQDTPFYDLPLYDLRGIYNTYFTNRACWLAQAEYRFRVGRRFYGVAFGGAANSSDDVAELSFKTPQFAAGGGLRFSLDEAEKINLRFDIGASPWGVQPYLGITEAF